MLHYHAGNCNGVIEVSTATTIGAPQGAIGAQFENDNTYNGWKNRETWLVALWFGNDEGMYRYMQDFIQELKVQEKSKDDAVVDLMEFIENFVDEQVENAQEKLGSGLLSDFLGGLSSEVDYYEIAMCELEDYEE